jgi:hypothetical protein
MNSRWSAFLLGLSFAAVYVLGCATARIIEPRASAQAMPPGAQRWEYLCLDGYNAETINQRANEAGAQGWEMAAALGSDRAPGLWCFRRAL